MNFDENNTTAMIGLTKEHERANFALEMIAIEIEDDYGELPNKIKRILENYNEKFEDIPVYKDFASARAAEEAQKLAEAVEECTKNVVVEEIPEQEAEPEKANAHEPKNTKSTIDIGKLRAYYISGKSYQLAATEMHIGRSTAAAYYKRFREAENDE